MNDTTGFASSVRNALAVLALAFTSMASAAVTTAVEYYHAGFNHYFITADPAEIALLDGGAYGGVWKRTGESFRVETIQVAGFVPICRFFSTSFAPRSSHFYTGSASECNTVKSNPNWQYEQIAFFLRLAPPSGVCTSTQNEVYRLYNNGMSGAPNHRYVTSIMIKAQMEAAGWVSEGTAFCSPVDAPLMVEKLQRLIGGTWTFQYTFVSTTVYTDTFVFTGITYASDGTPILQGRNKYNGTVGVGYSAGDVYLMLSPLGDSWDGFLFSFMGPNQVAGCYDFDADVEDLFTGSTCYLLAGQR